MSNDNNVTKQGKILYSIIESTCIIQLEGHIVYKISSVFDSFVKKILLDESVTSCIIDLRQTCYIDSTSLGIIAKLKDLLTPEEPSNVTIISTCDVVNEVLNNIGFNRIFTIIKDPYVIKAENFTEIKGKTCDVSNISKIMLEAHRNLARLNESNKNEFMEVIKYLEKDVSENSLLSI